MNLAKTFNSIIYFGTERTKEPSLKFDTRLINISCLFGAVACLLTSLISLGASSRSYQIMNLITAMACLVPIYSNYRGWLTLSKTIVIWVIPFLMIIYSYLFGNIGAEYYLFVGMALGIYFFRMDKNGILLTVGISGFGFLISKWIIWNQGQIVIDGIGLYLYFPNLIFCLLAIGWLTKRYRDHYQTQNSRIRSLHESRGRLLTVMSHDLRSPLNNLQYLIDLLDSETEDKLRQSQIINLLSDSLKSTSLLLDNATYWLNSEGDQLEAKSVDLNLNSIVNENIDLLYPIAERKNILISNRLESNFIIKGDKNIIKMILRNLLSNAVKFTPAKSKAIEIESKVEGDKLWLGVKDHGLGMDHDQVDFLMSTQRSSEAGTEHEAGTGMGLVLVKYFLKLMKSELVLESQKDKGTSVWFSLPIASIEQ